MTPPLRVLVVAHTHWDREWYHAAGRFRQRLVALVDELLDDPPPAGESFLLDGQGIVIDDYLAVRSERRSELAALLAERRIEAGPWYVLADELIPSGEALVRNLLAGRDVLGALGASAPPVLYCPDAFGHPAILPDLAYGFGHSMAIVWRGYGGRRWPDGDTVRWRGAAGEELLLYHLAVDGYELGGSLPATPAEARERWTRLERALRPRATLGIALLLNGADHHARQRNQHAAIAAIAEAATPDVVAPRTLHAAAAELTEAARDRALPAIEGELRDSYAYTWTLQGTLAARAAQKRRNAALERNLVRDVEPWIALQESGGEPGTRAVLRAAWRALLEGHPHDTLCGTSIDAVAIALDARHADVEDRMQGLREDAVARLASHDAERARHAQSSWTPVVLLRNRAARARGGVVELVLQSKLADVAVGPGSGTRQGARRRPPPWRVADMPLQLLAHRERVALTESPRDYPDADLVAEVRAVGWAAPIGGYVVETRPQSGAAPRLSGPAALVRAEGTTLDNGVLRVEVSGDGTVRLLEHATGRVVEDLVVLEDAADAGDLYTPAIRERRPAVAAARVRLVHGGPLRGEVAIDYRLPSARAGRSASRCRVSFVLDAAAPFVRIRVEGTNADVDHRLRIRLATGLAGGRTVADAAFHPVERRTLRLDDADEAMERVVPTAPLHRWVARFGSDAGATVFSDGLAEYESLDDGGVAVTLLRAVGVLSRPNLPERPGHAGWPSDTPLAQCLGTYSAELALALHGTDSLAQRDAIEQMADAVLLPLVGETLRSNVLAPSRSGGLELHGEGLAFSAAMPAREPGWVVLRCVNRRDEPVRGEWRTGRLIAEAKTARLDETPLAPIESTGDAVVFVAPPHALVTLLVRWAPVG